MTPVHGRMNALASYSLQAALLGKKHCNSIFTPIPVIMQIPSYQINTRDIQMAEVPKTFMWFGLKLPNPNKWLHYLEICYGLPFIMNNEVMRIKTINDEVYSIWWRFWKYINGGVSLRIHLTGVHSFGVHLTRVSTITWHLNLTRTMKTAGRVRISKAFRDSKLDRGAPVVIS